MPTSSDARNPDTYQDGSTEPASPYPVVLGRLGGDEDGRTRTPSLSSSISTEDTPPGSPDRKLKREVDSRRASMVQSPHRHDHQPKVIHPHHEGGHQAGSPVDWGDTSFGKAVASEIGEDNDSVGSPVRPINNMPNPFATATSAQALLAAAVGGHKVRRQSVVDHPDSSSHLTADMPSSWRRASIGGVADPNNDFRPMSSQGGGGGLTSRSRSGSCENTYEPHRPLSSRRGSTSVPHSSFSRSKSSDQKGRIGGGASQLPVMSRTSSSRADPRPQQHQSPSPTRPHISLPPIDAHHDHPRKAGFFFGGVPPSSRRQTGTDGGMLEATINDPMAAVGRRPSFRPRLTSFKAFQTSTVDEEGEHMDTPEEEEGNGSGVGHNDSPHLLREESPRAKEPSHDPFADAGPGGPGLFPPIERRHSYHAESSTQSRRMRAVGMFVNSEPVMPMQAGYRAMGEHHEPDYIPQIATDGWMDDTSTDDDNNKDHSPKPDFPNIKNHAGTAHRSASHSHINFASSGFGVVRHEKSEAPPQVRPFSSDVPLQSYVGDDREGVLSRRASIRRSSFVGRVGGDALNHNTTSDGDPIITSTTVIRRQLQTLDEATRAYHTSIKQQVLAADRPETAYIASLEGKKEWDQALDALEDARTAVTQEIIKMGQRLSVKESAPTQMWLVRIIKGLILEGDRIRVPFAPRALDQFIDYSTTQDAKDICPLNGGVSVRRGGSHHVGRREVLEGAARRILMKAHGFRTRRANIHLLSALFHHVVAGVDFPTIISELNVPIWACQNGHGRLLGLILQFSTVREMLTLSTMKRMIATSIAAMAVMGQEFVSPLTTLRKLEHYDAHQEESKQRASISDPTQVEKRKAKGGKTPAIACGFCRDSFTVIASIELFYSLVTAAPYIPVCAPPLSMSSDDDADTTSGMFFGGDSGDVSSSLGLLVTSPSGMATSMSAVYESDATRKRAKERAKGIGKGRWARGSKAAFRELQLLWQEGAEVALAISVSDATARCSFGKTSGSYFSVADLQLLSALIAPTEVFLAATGLEGCDVEETEKQVSSNFGGAMNLMGVRRKSRASSSSWSNRSAPDIKTTGNVQMDAMRRTRVLTGLLDRMREYQGEGSSLNDTLIDCLGKSPSVGAALQGTTTAVQYMQHRLLRKLTKDEPYASTLNVDCFTCEAPINLVRERLDYLDLPSHDDDSALSLRTPGALSDGLTILARACVRGNIELTKQLVRTASEKHGKAAEKYDKDAADSRRCPWNGISHTAPSCENDESFSITDDTFTLETSQQTFAMDGRSPEAGRSNLSIPHCHIAPTNSNGVVYTGPTHAVVNGSGVLPPTHPCAYTLKAFGCSAFHLAVVHASTPVVRVFLMQTSPREALAKHVIGGHSSRGTAAISLTLIPHNVTDTTSSRAEAADAEVLHDHIALLNQYGAAATNPTPSSAVYPTGVQIASRIATLNQLIDGTLLRRHISERTKALDHQKATLKDRDTVAQTLRYEAIYHLLSPPASLLLKSSLLHEHIHERSLVGVFMPELLEDAVSDPHALLTHKVTSNHAVGFEILVTLDGIAASVE